MPINSGTYTYIKNYFIHSEFTNIHKESLSKAHIELCGCVEPPTDSSFGHIIKEIYDDKNGTNNEKLKHLLIYTEGFKNCWDNSEHVRMDSDYFNKRYAEFKRLVEYLVHTKNLDYEMNLDCRVNKDKIVLYKVSPMQRFIIQWVICGGLALLTTLGFVYLGIFALLPVFGLTMALASGFSTLVSNSILFYFMNKAGLGKVLMHSLTCPLRILRFILCMALSCGVLVGFYFLFTWPIVVNFLAAAVVKTTFNIAFLGIVGWSGLYIIFAIAVILLASSLFKEVYNFGLEKKCKMKFKTALAILSGTCYAMITVYLIVVGNLLMLVIGIPLAICYISMAGGANSRLSLKKIDEVLYKGNVNSKGLKYLKVCGHIVLLLFSIMLSTLANMANFTLINAMHLTFAFFTISFAGQAASIILTVPLIYGVLILVCKMIKSIFTSYFGSVAEKTMVRKRFSDIYKLRSWKKIFLSATVIVILVLNAVGFSALAFSVAGVTAVTLIFFIASSVNSAALNVVSVPSDYMRMSNVSMPISEYEKITGRLNEQVDDENHDSMNKDPGSNIEV